MGVFRFRLPGDLPSPWAQDLTRSCVAGGYDAMPGPAFSTVAGDLLSVTREASESGSLVAPFEVADLGRFLGTSATLIERDSPYDLLVELARGKINQLRNQAADWVHGGMTLGDDLRSAMHEAGRLFAGVVTLDGPRHDAARAALSAGCHAADQLVDSYLDQILRARHSRQGPLEAAISVRVNGTIPPAVRATLADSVTAVAIPMSWRAIEPTEAEYRWDAVDPVIEWAEQNELAITGGPLIDMSPRGLPDWLWLWEGDLQSLASFCCDYIETTVGRYRGKIRRWQLAAGMNLVGTLKLGEEDLLWLTARLAEAAWQVDPDVELTLGLAQPWGDYLGRKEHTYSPFIFADTLIRAGLRLAALELEWYFGAGDRGSYARDLLDGSRILDLYSLLGVPLQVALGYPAAAGRDNLADHRLDTEGVGFWRGPPSDVVQAAWAAAYGRLALGKPFVKAITWAHLTDGEEHLLPHSGLVDPAGQIRPAMSVLKSLRDEHLK